MPNILVTEYSIFLFPPKQSMNFIFMPITTAYAVTGVILIDLRAGCRL